MSDHGHLEVSLYRFTLAQNPLTSRDRVFFKKISSVRTNINRLKAAGYSRTLDSHSRVIMCHTRARVENQAQTFRLLAYVTATGRLSSYLIYSRIPNSRAIDLLKLSRFLEQIFGTLG